MLSQAPSLPPVPLPSPLPQRQLYPGEMPHAHGKARNSGPRVSFAERCWC